MYIRINDRYRLDAANSRVIRVDAAGNATGSMAWYPERDADALAGDIDELTAWTLICDIAAEMRDSGTPVSPRHILIDGAGFRLSELATSHDARFTAPEGYSAVWALGATVFYLFMGCHVFQGLGGKVQTAATPVPVLRRELPELSETVARCLDFSPSRRPDTEELTRIARANIERCKKTAREFPPLREAPAKVYGHDETERLWPEEMA